MQRTPSAIDRDESSALASGELGLGEGHPPQQTVRSEVLTLL